MATIYRVRVPLKGSAAFAYGEIAGVPVILEGDRDEFRSIGEALGARLQPLEFSGACLVVAAGQEACELLHNWDQLPWSEGGVVVAYALGTGIAWRPQPRERAA